MMQQNFEASSKQMVQNENIYEAKNKMTIVMVHLH